MDRGKYISNEEALLIVQSLQEQLKQMKEELTEKFNIKFKSEINNVSVMTEVGDTNGNE